jgi:small-conductance mechanosensitive channel
VREITLSYTTLVSDDGPYVYVPNQKMVSEMLVNRSVSGEGDASLAPTRSP